MGGSGGWEWWVGGVVGGESSLEDDTRHLRHKHGILKAWYTTSTAEKWHPQSVDARHLRPKNGILTAWMHDIYGRKMSSFMRGCTLVSFVSCYQKTLSTNALGANFTGEPLNPKP